MAKQTVEDSLILDAVECARRGCLADGSRFRMRWRQGQREIATLTCYVKDGWLDLYFVRTGDMTNDHHDQVELTRTLSSFGAERVWFICPGCGRQVRKLYLPPGAFHFGCRICHDLSYLSRQTRGHSPRDDSKRLERLRLLAERLHREAEARRLKVAQMIPAFPPELFSEGLEPGPHPVKRPPGRPKVKRPYRRTRPFLSAERGSQREGLCMRCRDYREIGSPQPGTLANGRPALKGTCPVCGAKMTLIVKRS